MPRASSSARPLSIEGPSNVNNNEPQMLEPLANQPRQPTSLQGLLRFTMEANSSQSAATNTQFQPMDEEVRNIVITVSTSVVHGILIIFLENLVKYDRCTCLQRREFLKQTLSSLSCSVIEELQKAIKVLSNLVDLGPDDDTTQHEIALESIADFVDNIDIANDFYKVGGFSIFAPCLNSPHSSIRWRAADIIAEVSQNNPFCQEKFLESGLFPTLLNMIDTDPAEMVRVKALYAVSCEY